MPAVDIVPTSNKLITYTDIFEKLTVPQFNSNIRYNFIKAPLFVPTRNQTNLVHVSKLSVKGPF